MRLVEIANSVPYLRDQLSAARGVGRAAAGLDLSGGTVRAFLPNQQLAQSFAEGSLPGEELEAQAVDMLADWLIAEFHITKSQQVCLVCQFADGPTERPPVADNDFRYSTAWLEGAPEPYENGELWLADETTDRATLVKMLRENLWYPGVAAIASRADQAQLVPNSSIAFRDLRTQIEKAHMILCAAWDSMNYLLWTPSQPDGISSGRTRQGSWTREELPTLGP